MSRKVEKDAAYFRAVYWDLMEEIKRRTDVINSLIMEKIPVPKIISYELCYLQLRMICELIALACIAAHGDSIKITGRKLNKTYNADKILKELERLHADFYPVPTKQIMEKKVGRVFATEKITSGFLTKEDLKKLYGECGDRLHKGNLKKILAGEPNELEFARIKGWLEKVVTLLNHHQIQLINEKQMLFVLMKSQDEGKVQVALMEAVE